MDDISAVMKKQFPVTAPPPPKPSWLDQTVSGVKEFGQKHGRDIAGIAGSTVGGILAAPEAIAAGIPTIGLGGIATEAGGIGLGNAIGTQLYDRFAGRKQTLPQQAMTAAQDVAGGAASVPAGQLIGAGVRVAAPAAGEALAAVLGKTSGLGGGVKTAYNAGNAGGVPAAKFKTAISAKESPIKEALTDAAAKLKAGYDARNLHYQTEIAPISKDSQQISFDPIDTAIVEQSSTALGRRGQVKNPEANQVIEEIKTKVNEYNKNGWNTPGDLDDLKQTVGNIRSKSDPGSPEFRAADQIHSAIEQAITEKAPDYANVMRDYSNASSVLSDTRRGLGIGSNATSPNQIARLLSALKGTTETGVARSQLLGNLAGQGDQTLMPTLAGIASRPLLPRGLGATALTTGELLTAALTHENPTASAAQVIGSLAFSPRLVGGGAFAAGKSAAAAKRLLASIPAPVKSAILANALSKQSAPIQQDQAQGGYN